MTVVIIDRRQPVRGNIMHYAAEGELVYSLVAELLPLSLAAVRSSY